jgi:hypothetical protein
MSEEPRVLRMKGITTDTPDPVALAGFWQATLGYERRDLWEPFVGLRDPAGRDPLLTFQRRSGAGPNTMHFDLYADDVDAEVGRLVGLGAERVRKVEEGDTWWWVLRDPGGNLLCVVAATGSDRAV